MKTKQLRFEFLPRYYEGKRRQERPRVCKFCALERRGPYIIVRPRVFPVLGAAGTVFLPYAGSIFCFSGAAPSSWARRLPSSVSSDTTPTARASPTGVARGSKRATGASLRWRPRVHRVWPSVPSVQPGHRPPRPRACPGLAAWQVPSKAAAGCPVHTARKQVPCFHNEAPHAFRGSFVQTCDFQPSNGKFGRLKMPTPVL